MTENKIEKSKEITITLSKEKLMNWTRLTLLGGVFVIAPIACVYYLFASLFGLVKSLISPVTSVIIKLFGFGPLFADIASMLVIIASCFLTGALVKTRLGKYMHDKLDYILSKVPGYDFIRNLFKQVLTSEGFSFADKKPCIIEPYGKGNGKLIGFVMDYSVIYGFYSVFCPSAPNPTSGYTFTVCEGRIQMITETSSEDVLKVITFCGIGTASIIEQILIKENSKNESLNTEGRMEVSDLKV